MRRVSEQQTYDRGVTIFSPDGRLYQVEYARQAVEQGTTSIGLTTTSGVVFVVKKRRHSPLIVETSIEKIHTIDHHLGIASTGHVADGRALVDFARRQAQVNRRRYAEPIGVETLTTVISDHIQESTQIGGTRPFGVALLIGGIENGRPCLYQTDSSGNFWAWQATAIGERWREAEQYLEQQYETDLTIQEGVKLALTTFDEVTDESLVPAEIGVGTITDGSGQFHHLTNEDIRDYLETDGYSASRDDLDAR